MSGENVEVWGNAKLLETNGQAIPNGSVVLAGTVNYDKAVDGLNYPDAQFILSCAFATAPLEGSLIAVYARTMGLDGALNAQIPEASRPTKRIGYFEVDNVTSAQVMDLIATDVPRIAQYYLHNVNTGQSLGSGWRLMVVPRTYKPAP